MNFWFKFNGCPQLARCCSPPEMNCLLAVACTRRVFATLHELVCAVHYMAKLYMTMCSKTHNTCLRKHNLVNAMRSSSYTWFVPNTTRPPPGGPTNPKNPLYISIHSLLPGVPKEFSKLDSSYELKFLLESNCEHLFCLSRFLFQIGFSFIQNWFFPNGFSKIGLRF